MRLFKNLKTASRPKLYLLILLTVVLLLSSGCINEKKGGSQLILATTTSVQDSGVLDVLIEDFQRLNPKFNIKPVAVGSGEAIAMGQRGDSDILLVHSPEDEKQFINKELGINRLTIMYNYFVILGPSNDPAKLKGKTAADSFKAIHKDQSAFVSRSDQSGTHKKELKLWSELSLDPKKNPKYIQTGQGMAETIRIADQKQGYTLSDTGTFLALKNTISLVVLSKNDKALLNEYSVIEVNPVRHKNINKEGAVAFSKYMQTTGKQIIKSFGHNEFGETLFSVY